jgi:hypothetical protein
LVRPLSLSFSQAPCLCELNDLQAEKAGTFTSSPQRRSG